MRKKILLLGGTIGARQIAEAIANSLDVDATVSLSGATTTRQDYALPMRVGGFGGADGLRQYLVDNQIDLIVDATHPYAAQMSRNAVVVSTQAGIPLVVFDRPAWEPVAGDKWTMAPDVDWVLKRLERLRPRNVFLPLGRKEIHRFEAVPKHNYLIRSIEAFYPPLNLPHATHIRSQPPYDKADEVDLMKRRRIDLMVVKNSGGASNYPKIAAARELGIRVVMIRRPALAVASPCRSVCETVATIAEFVRHNENLVA